MHHSPYRVEAEAHGFKRYRRDIDPPAGERVGVDIPLEIGQVNETVKVTAEARLLEP